MAGNVCSSSSSHLDIYVSRHHDVSVRTTLTLEPDVADRLKELAKLEDKPFKQW